MLVVQSHARSVILSLYANVGEIPDLAVYNLQEYPPVSLFPF